MKYPILTSSKDNLLRLHEDYEIENIIIPAGFKSDGLTLKNKLLRIFVNKYEPKFSPFYMLHDYLTSKKRFKEADEKGAKILFQIEDSFRTHTMIKLIKIYHEFRYKVKFDS